MFICRSGHVVAEAVGEVCRVHAGIYPAAYAVRDTKSYGARVMDAANKEGVMARFRTGGFSTMPRWRDAVVGIEVEDVGRGVVGAVFGDEGGGDGVGESGGGGV